LGASGSVARNLTVNGIGQFMSASDKLTIGLGSFSGNNWGALAFNAIANASNQTVTYSQTGITAAMIVNNYNDAANGLSFLVAPAGTTGNTITLINAGTVTDAGAWTLGDSAATNNSLTIPGNGYITSGTSDASDNRSMTISGGGGGSSWNQNRGAGIVMQGNEAGGDITYYAGNISGGSHAFFTGGVEVGSASYAGAWTLGATATTSPAKTLTVNGAKFISTPKGDLVYEGVFPKAITASGTAVATVTHATTYAAITVEVTHTGMEGLGAITSYVYAKRFIRCQPGSIAVTTIGTDATSNATIALAFVSATVFTVTITNSAAATHYSALHLKVLAGGDDADASRGISSVTYA
jgi:hypothetical protein